MPFIPHTQDEIRQMLASIGVKSIDDLFDEIPRDLWIDELAEIPSTISEYELTRLLQQRAQSDMGGLCFIGAGAYEHHVPSPILDLIGRGEFLTAYTPYQAEASQGSLQLIYEYQTMMANLTGLDVSNASLYDGASALAEAMLMAIRLNQTSSSRTVLLPRTLNPAYRRVVKAITQTQGIKILEVDYDHETGQTTLAQLAAFENKDIAAFVIPQPNFFGVLEDVDALTNWAKKQNMVTVACVNPTSLALLKAPGQWGEKGVDIACGEGQALGVPLASGGPYFGFLCCKQEHVRQMPGRIVGKTHDLEGKTGFVLTLQAREQHIRRSKATSNICTNQGLMVVAATIYLSLLGAEGLLRVAAASHQNTRELVTQLTSINGVTQVFNSAFFHESVIRVPQADQVLAQLANLGIQGGYSLQQDYPELPDSILLCATETKLPVDIVAYYDALHEVLAKKKSETPELTTSA
jgi:glycine dehydrogenase subunit 1